MSSAPPSEHSINFQNSQTCMKRLTTSVSSTSTLHTLKTLIHQKLYTQALKSSFSRLTPHLTNPTFALFLKSGFLLNPFLSSSLITHFCLLGDLSSATQVFHQTHQPDVVVFNSLISGYARFSHSNPVFELFNKLRELGLNPDVYTLSSLIKVSDFLIQNEIAHAVSTKMGVGSSSVFITSGLVENYFRHGFVCEAEKCFEESLVLDCVVLNVMINGYVWNGELEKGREVFMEGKELGLELNEFSLTSVVGAVFDVREGEQIHGFSLKIGFLCGCSAHLNNAVMNIYTRCGCDFDAVKVFEEMPNPDVVSWTERIGVAYDREEAMELFKFCLAIGLDVNEYTMIKILSKIDVPSMLAQGKQIHGFCNKAGYLVVVSVCNALISMYGNGRQMSDAKRLFDEMDFQDSVSWNSLIAGYSEDGCADQAIAVLSQMRYNLLQPNKYTFASIIEVLPNLNSPEQTMQIHGLMIKVGVVSDDSMLSCLITAYGKCNGIKESKRVFNEIDKVDVVHLNAMAAALAHAGYYVDVLNVFKTRSELSLETDSETFSIVLKACGVLTDLELGRAMHSLALKSGIHLDNFIESAIIGTYCKCGSVDDAEKAFRNVAKGNLAAWNAMIMGYAQSGRYHNVCELFCMMCESKMKPDEITYLGVLSSCCHKGLVNEAQHYLNSMFGLHGVIPCLEHYACVIDTLGRVGLLEDAKKTIDRMPLSPDARIWQVLLSACSIHGNIDLGEIAARKLLELQPENDSGFVLLSKIYASAGMWSTVGELRREMKEKNVCKEPGSSWIQVGDHSSLLC